MTWPNVISSRLDQRVPAFHATTARQQSGAFQREKNLFQKLQRNMLARRNLMALESRLAMEQREFQERTQSIFTFFGELHLEILSMPSELIKY